jgi:hypothetical protein
MSTTTKNCPKVQKKQTPPPPPVPVFAKIPCPRDQQAYGLYLEQHTQRWIADKLKCTQPTVLRGIRRMEAWLAKTLPEDRGEYTATEKLRLALAKHERLMERLLKMSLREFRRSRQTIPMKKTITTTDTKNEQGEPVKIRIEEWDKPQIGRKGFIDSAAKTSHELTVLAAGWLGAGSGTISMAQVMDPEERDRWDRLVTTRDAQIKELQQRDEVPVKQPVAPPAAPVSEVVENNHNMYQENVKEVYATSGGEEACVPAPDTASPPIDHPQNLYQDPPETSSQQTPCAGPSSTESRAAGVSELPAPEPEPVKVYRWEANYRQEALDYHCQINQLPPAKLAQASGIPDPLRMTPVEAIRRGLPYIISIDRSAEIQRTWERQQRENLARPESERY